MAENVHDRVAEKRGPGRPKGSGGGMTSVTAKNAKNLAQAVREGVPADIMRDFHLCIVMEHIPKVIYDGDGDMVVVCTCCGVDGQRIRGIILPSLREKQEAMDWLANRGYGAPVNMTASESLVRHEVTVRNTAIAELSLSQLADIQQQLLRAMGVEDSLGSPRSARVGGASQASLPAGIVQEDVIDVDSVDDSVDERADESDVESDETSGNPNE